QVIWPHRIRAKTIAREGFDGEGEGNTEIFGADRVVPQAEAEGRGPAPEIPVDRVDLFLHAAFANIESVRGPRAPIFIQPIEETAGKNTFAFAKGNRRVGDKIVPEIKMA